MAARNQMLDALRAVAVLLVIGNHFHVTADSPAVLRWWHRGGWMGVDLFFVLSGFLVSGLLFAEWQKRGSLRIGRFLVRRGFKIYPAFWVFLAATLLAWFVRDLRPTYPVTLANSLSEIAFLQNYCGRIWNHTWSLAVEEHFYIGLAVLMAALTLRGSKDPFRVLPYVFGAIGVACLAVRLRHLGEPYDFYAQMSRTHERIDSLFFGVLLSYAFHFHQGWLLPLVRRLRIVLLIGSALLFAPVFALEREANSWLVTAWPTCLYLASGALLLCLVTTPLPVPAPLSRVGVYSYSIYLWHMPVAVWVMPLIQRRWSPANHDTTAALLSVLVSVAVGIVFSRLVEYPTLALRDRWFPSRSAAGSQLPDRASEPKPSHVPGRPLSAALAGPS